MDLFLRGGQGTVRPAVLIMDRSCYSLMSSLNCQVTFNFQSVHTHNLAMHPVFIIDVNQNIKLPRHGIGIHFHLTPKIVVHK